jgi:hypothetical protein
VKRSHALVLATTLAVAVAAGFGQTASAAVSKHASSEVGITPAHGKIGNARPVPGAAARIRALGLDDGEGELGSDDGGGGLAGGRAAHGTIGSAAPTVGAAARIASLGLDD